MKSFVSFLVPGGLIFLAAIGFLRPNGLPHWVQTPVHAIPYIVLIFGLVFGWYLSSSRLILSILVLAFADRAIRLFPPMDSNPDSIAPTMFAIVAVLLPLNLLALSLVKEGEESSWKGTARLILILSQPFLVFWLSLPAQAQIALPFLQPVLPPALMSWTILPQPALFTFLGAFVLLSVKFVLNRDPLDGGSFWAIVTTFVALHTIRYGWQPTNFFSAAGLILFVTLVQAAHQRSYRDELTGVLGKQAYDETLHGLGTRYVVAVVGIDQLKQYGNQYGKQVSEQVLRVVAQKIEAAAEGEKVFRLAGEEFTMIFRSKTTTDTLATLDRIRKAVEGISLYLRKQTRVWEGQGSTDTGSNDISLPVTVSVGVMESGGPKSTLDSVTKLAYRALYEAKGEGGNIVKRGVANPVPVRRTQVGHIAA